MSWAARRRFIILIIVGSVVAAFLIALFISVFYEAPSCSDGVMNQNETGVDCGGVCPYLCTHQLYQPIVLFTKTLPNEDGRIDIIARVENKNADAAAKDVPYTVTIYGPDQSRIQEISGTVDLPSGSSVPIFIPVISPGPLNGVRAFLEIDPLAPRWFYMPRHSRIMPTVSNSRHLGTINAPRVNATLTNQSAFAFNNVRVVVLVRNKKGDIIAASSTIIPSIPAHGQSTVIFTWNTAFLDIPASIEVVPIVELP